MDPAQDNFENEFEVMPNYQWLIQEEESDLPQQISMPRLSI
jgi:hypothetical protein